MRRGHRISASNHLRMPELSCFSWNWTKPRNRLAVQFKGDAPRPAKEGRYFSVTIHLDSERFVTQFGLARAFTFGDKIECLGLLTEEKRADAPGHLWLKVVYRAITEMDTDYTFSYLVPIRGRDPWRMRGSVINGLYPTSRWSPDEIVLDELHIALENASVAAVNQIWLTAINQSTYWGSPDFHLEIDGEPGQRRAVIKLDDMRKSAR